MITVANLFLIVNLIIFILLMFGIHLKKVRIFVENDIKSLVPSIIFIITLAVLIFQGIYTLVLNWNNTIG